MADPAATDEELLTISDYVEAIRAVLQDVTVPTRYADMDILVGFNMMLLEARRLRADLFVSKWGAHVPRFSAVDGSEVNMDAQFRLGFVYGAAAYVMTFDAEDVQDARANSFMERFSSILTGTRPTPVQGGTPGPGSPQK